MLQACSKWKMSLQLDETVLLTVSDTSDRNHTGCFCNSSKADDCSRFTGNNEIHTEDANESNMYAGIVERLKF